MMLKYRDIILEKQLPKGHHILHLDNVYPVQLVPQLPHTKWIDDIQSSTQYANAVEVELKGPTDIKICLDEGIYVQKDGAFTDHFLHDDLWQGGDGIFSFNLDQGKDAFGPQKDAQTLFVFGDTFVGSYHPQTFKRFQPTLMPNNSLARMSEQGIDFKIQMREGLVSSFFTVDPIHNLSGTIAANLKDDDEQVYLTQFRDNPIQLEFDFQQLVHVTELEVANYFDATEPLLNNRGVKAIQWETSTDQITYTPLETTHHVKGSADATQVFEIDTHTRYLRGTITESYHDGSTNDHLVGLRYIGFRRDEKPYRDFDVDAPPGFETHRTHAWLWLQDGIVIDDRFYFIPMRVVPDATQPEGLQFKVIGTMLFEVLIRDGELDVSAIRQKPVPLFHEEGSKTTMFGAAIMNHADIDGFIYVYGYQATLGGRKLIVARTRPNDFWCVDNWEYFVGDTWSSVMTDVTPVLPHVSCEMSVSHLNTGPHKGQFIAVFTYDTDTPYIAVSMAPAPTGPFSDPQIIYKTEEAKRFKSTTYTYNAKAHPHLSSATDILVSYNTNTYNYEHNMSDARIYRPRFIRLKSVEK